MQTRRTRALVGRSEEGLSLQEMLVVIAVFAVLAFILMISSNQVMIKTRLSRVRQEQQMLSSAIENWRLENYRYPSTISKLVKPMGFLNELPKDPFARDTSSAYTYYCLASSATGRNLAIIVSTGPDGVIDFFPPNMGAASVNGPEIPEVDILRGPIMQELIGKSYDPTNGLSSKGDVIKININ